VETQWSAPNLQLYLHRLRSKHSWLNSELCQSTLVWKVLSFNPPFELPVCCYLYNGLLYALGFLESWLGTTVRGSIYFLELHVSTLLYFGIKISL
jgi:hypothetical protein